MTLLGRAGMTHSGGRAERREAGEVDDLKRFVEEKKDASVQRPEELKKKRAELKKRQITPATASRDQAVAPVDDEQRQRLVEKFLEAQVEVQLLGRVSGALNARHRDPFP